MLINTNYSTVVNSINATNMSCTKIQKIPLPDFDDDTFLISRPLSLSDDEWREKIVAQALKDQLQGKFQPTSAEYQQLKRDYISVVSPDRKAIISAAVDTINNSGTKKDTIDFILSVLCGKVIYQKGEVQVTFARIFDSDGTEIAHYFPGAPGSNNGWLCIGTKAEFARSREFNSIYNETWWAADKTNTADCTPTGESQVSVIQKESYLSAEQFSAYNEARKQAPIADNEAVGKETYEQYDFGYDEYEIKVDAVG